MRRVLHNRDKRHFASRSRRCGKGDEGRKVVCEDLGTLKGSQIGASIGDRCRRTLASVDHRAASECEKAVAAQIAIGLGNVFHHVE